MKQLKMLRDLKEIPELYQPEGFTLRKYVPGDEMAWLEICKHGLVEENAGLECWKEFMLDIEGVVPERDVFFYCDAEGVPVATFAVYTLPNGRGNMHMVAAKPEARGNHLGWAIVTKVLQETKDRLGENGYACLTTDEWRNSAVAVYLRGGYHPLLLEPEMQQRWQGACDDVNIHGVEMWDDNGCPTGIVL